MRKWRRFILCLTVGGWVASGALATASRADTLPKDPRRPGYLDVRARANYHDPNALYWEGFELKNEGLCDEAVPRLQPLADRGRGYEDAQHALGICLLEMSGVPRASGTPPARAVLFDRPNYRKGLLWIERAAQSGAFMAQRSMVALYLADLGPDTDPIELAKWLQLYEVNPIRLSLGASDTADHLSIQAHQVLTHHQILEGKERARNWNRSYWKPVEHTDE